MHFRRLTFPLFLLASTLAYPQAPAAGGPAYTLPCDQKTTADHACPAATVPALYSGQEPISFQSIEREAWITRSQTVPPPRPRPMPRAGEPQAQSVQSPHAEPDAPDQSELLKNSKDREFILRNFKTMYVTTQDIQFFNAQQMKAALGRNPDFQKLNINIVDDRRVADVVLIVSYTFAWDYPFELRHQNTTTVLFSGKGEGPFSGPLGAADVAREFVELAKPWRTGKVQTK